MIAGGETTNTIITVSVCAFVCDAGDGTSLGRVHQAGEISRAVEDGVARTYEPQRHPSGET